MLETTATKPRMWSQISTSERDALLAEFETDREGLRNRFPELNLKMVHNSLEIKLREWRKIRPLMMRHTAHTVASASTGGRKYTDYLELEGDDWMIISDIEIPDHNPLYLLLMVLVAMVNGVRKLIIAGDLVATDQQALTAWTEVLNTGDEINFEASVGIVVRILKKLFEWFDEVYLIEGNHDNRVARATKGQVHFGMFLNGTNVVYSRYGYLWIKSSRGWIKVVHQQNFSIDPVKLGQDYNDSEVRKCHWVTTHCHRRQSGWTKDGLFEVHAIGTGRDEAKTKYKSQGQNKHRQWDISFLMIKGGYFYDFDLKSTNWKHELREFYQEYITSPFVIAWFKDFAKKLGVPLKLLPTIYPVYKLPEGIQIDDEEAA